SRRARTRTRCRSSAGPRYAATRWPCTTARAEPRAGLTGAAGPQHALGDRPAVHLGGAVIDAERPHLAEQAGDDRIVGDAEPAEDLHRAVDDAPDRLGAHHLGDARFVAPALAFVEHPGAVPDRHPADMQI